MTVGCWLFYEGRQREAIGMRRSRPKASPVIFTPGGACRRLYSLRSTICMMRDASFQIDIGFIEKSLHWKGDLRRTLSVSGSNSL